MKPSIKILDKIAIVLGLITIIWFATLLIHMHNDYKKIKADASIIITSQDYVIKNQEHIIKNQEHIISNQSFYMSNSLNLFPPRNW